MTPFTLSLSADSRIFGEKAQPEIWGTPGLTNLRQEETFP